MNHGFDHFLFKSRRPFIRLVALASILLLPDLASADECEVTEGPPGTITMPPAGCDYLNEGGVLNIVDDLPTGTTIDIDMEHKGFFCGEVQGQMAPCSIALPSGTCEGPGGSLGGTVACFYSEAVFSMTGTGQLAGFSRTITLPITTEVHIAPRTPGDPVQSFDTEMVKFDGQLFGDPDFDILRIRAGSNFGLTSPGHTTLTDIGGGIFAVDSFFDLDYEIEFQGAPGSALEGFSGTTNDAITIRAGEPIPPGVPALSNTAWLLLAALTLAIGVMVLRHSRPIRPAGPRIAGSTR